MTFIKYSIQIFTLNIETYFYVTPYLESNKEYLRSLEKEVDLHITELVDKPEGLSNFEMLNIQLEKFENELDAAIFKNMKKIIFIHGVGNGRLKQEIIEKNYFLF